MYLFDLPPKMCVFVCMNYMVHSSYLSSNQIFKMWKLKKKKKEEIKNLRKKIKIVSLKSVMLFAGPICIIVLVHCYHL